MHIPGASHIAIGVRDMDRSLRFYRDLLGLQVSLDRLEPPQDVPGAPPPRRRAAYLRWGPDAPGSTFLVLDQQLPQAQGEPLALFRVGVHHIGFWVDDVQAMYDRLTAAGFPASAPVRRVSAHRYGDLHGPDVLYAFFQDPDGITVQLDQRAPAIPPHRV